MPVINRLADSTPSHALNQENLWSIEEYSTGVDNEVEGIAATVFVQMLG